MKTTRRDFAIMGAGSLLSGLTVPSLLASTEAIPVANKVPVSAGPWYRRVKRTGQTNFNERDPQNANVEQWADYWASTKVQALALSVSGPVAFYPTRIPYFHRSSFLGERDLFGDCVKAAKARGMRIYGRMSPDIQWMDPKLIAEHPLWFRHNQDGSLQSSAPDIAFTCQFGGHFSEQQPAIIRELNANYDIDGLYMNGWPTMQVCYCDNCRKIGDPHSAEYKAALMASAGDLINLYKSVVMEKSPHNFYSCNLGGGLKESGLDQWKLTREALWYTADNQSRASVIAPVWQDAQQVKFALALMGDRPVAAVSASYARAGAISWRNVTDTSVEPECRMAQTAAAGGVVWYHWLGLEQGFQEDRRWQNPGRDFLAWHAKHDKHFHNVRSLARIAIVVAPKSMTVYEAPTKEDKTDSIEGMYSVLVEARIPFDFLHEEDLTVEHMQRYAALILPNVALLSNAQCKALEAYADGGGSLLATFETSLYDETGTPRDDFALGELFGIKKVGSRQRSEPKSAESMTSVHLQSVKKRNALTAGFEDTEWIAGPVWSIPLAPVADPVMTTIHPYPVYPPEAVYTRQPPSDSPSIVAREKGRARLVYLAGDMDASYWRLDNVDLGRQLTNAIRWVLRDEPGTEVVGQGLMEVCAWETESGFAIHLLNYNGPNAFRGRMRTPVPLGAQTVRVVVPRDVRIKTATLLAAEMPVKFQQQGRTVRLTVPAVKLYEVVALEV
ncbi:alpha-amylase family protein [Granulicella sibirica]|uniref:alpha-amylase family protein n=1 Tax=Granulicella sibirica TaxID=2479048 RepID=UPI001008965E|nr:alpha-amylase family protein [Granulicella sibirica]